MQSVDTKIGHKGTKAKEVPCKLINARSNRIKDLRSRPSRTATRNNGRAFEDDDRSSQSFAPTEMKAKLERSRQSARECRARKKLRYQYLEELVTHREKAVLQLREELEMYREWCRAVDAGQVPEELKKALAEPTEECEDYTNDV